MLPEQEQLQPFFPQLELPQGVQFGVMINASDYLTDTWQADLDAAFVPAADSAGSRVRSAAHI